MSYSQITRDNPFKIFARNILQPLKRNLEIKREKRSDRQAISK